MSEWVVRLRRSEIDPNHELQERREQLTVYNTPTPMVSGCDVLAQQRAAAQPQALALFTSDDPILVCRPDGAICDKAGALV